jgi:argininosuccinate lyase
MTEAVLWAKNVAAPDDRVQQFLAGEDVLLDRHLLPHDIAATIAHVRGLHRVGAVAGDPAAALEAALDDLAGAVDDGSFVLDGRYEDGHSAIEAELTRRLGDVGRMVHLGRSRNDQVLVAMRLWMRERLGVLRGHALDAAAACLETAGRHEMVPMPGYTHLQRAVPSSVGLWMAGIAESLLDDASLIGMTAEWMDACPLGTAAGYGVNVPLDRAGVARDLGFARLQLNPLSAQNGRGKHEAQAVMAAWQLLQDVRRLAWDLSLFTTSEFAFVRLPARLTTGSSIMPNKRNPDVVELLRATAATAAGALAELQQVLALPSGYHRDVQLTKAPTMRALLAAEAAAALVPDVVTAMEIDAARMAAAIDPDLHATDRAVELSLSGVPFRTAYRRIADEIGGAAERDPRDSLRARVSPGACADLGLEELGKRLEALRG